MKENELLETIIKRLESMKVKAEFPDFDRGWDSALEDSIEMIKGYLK